MSNEYTIKRRNRFLLQDRLVMPVQNYGKCFYEDNPLESIDKIFVMGRNHNDGVNTARYIISNDPFESNSITYMHYISSMYLNNYASYPDWKLRRYLIRKHIVSNPNCLTDYTFMHGSDTDIPSRLYTISFNDYAIRHLKIDFTLEVLLSESAINKTNIQDLKKKFRVYMCDGDGVLHFDFKPYDESTYENHVSVNYTSPYYYGSNKMYKDGDFTEFKCSYEFYSGSKNLIFMISNYMGFADSYQESKMRIIIENVSILLS